MSNKLKPDLKTIGKVEISLSFSHLRAFAENCNVMKAFTNTLFINLKKLQKNFAAATKAIEEANIESTMINERTEKLNDEYKGRYDDEQYIKLKYDLMEVIKDFNQRLFKVKIYTMAASEFPSDAEFLEKTKNDTKFVKSYLELLDICIIEPPEDDDE